MAYATTADVQARMTRTLSADELSVCAALLDDAAVLIDGCAVSASAEAKLVVSCRMVIRAIGDGGASGIPAGATQGQMSALGYSQIRSDGPFGPSFLRPKSCKLFQNPPFFSGAVPVCMLYYRL